MKIFRDLGPVRLNLSARISQPFNSVFLSQQISINISRFYSQPNRELKKLLVGIFSRKIHINME
jgi:hypothetical protein